MDLNNDDASIKIYVISLVVAILVLSTAVTVSYRQIKSLEESSKQVNHFIIVEREIHKMFSSYAIQKSALFDYAISHNPDFLNGIEQYKLQGQNAVSRLKSLTQNDPVQQANIDQMLMFREEFLIQIESLINEKGDSYSPDNVLMNAEMGKISILMENMRLLRDQMIWDAEVDLRRNNNVYNSSIKFTPLTIWAVALFSLVAFILAFWRILWNRREMKETKAFLTNILKSTENMIDHYKPIRDENQEIVDFKIVYTNDRIASESGLMPKDIIGKKLSELYPVTFENGYFRMLKECMDNDQVVQFEHHYNLMENVKTFWSTAIKLGDAVTITSVDVTPLKSSALKLEEINRELEEKSTALDQAELIASGGSFRLDIITGNAYFSKNFHRVLGFKNREIAVSFNKFRSFVHPSDLELFDNFVNEIMENKVEAQQSYRIITKEGATRNLITTGRIIIENDREFLVGVMQDITSEMQSKLVIEDQNIELKRSNEELDSFNRVVSHDLQEPLRKIQMFISMISEDALLNDENREYFNKIVRDAQRMQTLITHLLSYSRIGNNDKDFERIKLNNILDKVLQNQNFLIADEIKVTIKSLPTVRGIPFQMEQLFTNLLTNAIKYGKEGEINSIIVSSELVPSKDIEQDFRKKSLYYHKITVSDTGIGFNQDHADKIFEVFQRLHSDRNSGTGIGLAICKKIVENHNGIITAEGKVQVGAVFTIFLPKDPDEY